MKTRPKTLLILSVFFAVVVVAFPIQIMALYEHGPLEVTAIISKLAPLNWAIMVLGTFSAIAFYRASPLTVVLMPLMSVIVAWNNWLVARVGTDYSATTACLATLGFALVGGSIFTPAAWEALMNPERRWWMTPERKRVSAPVYIIPENGEAFKTQTFDISSGGAFIPQKSDGPLHAGDRMTVRLTMGALSVVRCEAKVVRTTPAKGAYPGGVGIQFLNIARLQADELERCMKVMAA